MALLAQAVALPADVDDVAMMEKSVEDGGGGYGRSTVRLLTMRSRQRSSTRRCLFSSGTP
jgi:hypothetical protein